jgi:phosphoribosyl-ATP pyrophosphohydrolase
MLRGDAVSIERNKVVSEAGDVLWNLAMVLDDMNISFNDVARTNISKLENRLAEGTIQGRGDR